jgi:signal transduction histidine kinase
VIENLSKFSLEYVSQTAKVSLLDCLHTAVGLMNVRAQKKNITITNNVSSDITVNTDAQKLGQVLVNILSNSIDFCEQGCTIELDVEKDEKSRDSIRLLIRDNGPGIAEEILPKIFDPFFTTKEVGKGIGLGMTISHKLMEECGGSIDVFSKVHEGTTVVLVMPRD